MPVMPATNFVHPDEPCCSLSELMEQSFDGMHRYQIMHVVRGDRLAEFRTDMGKASSYHTLPFQIIGGYKDGQTGRIYIEETVGRLRDMANQMRDRDESSIALPVSNLLEGYANLKG